MKAISTLKFLFFGDSKNSNKNKMIMSSRFWSLSRYLLRNFNSRIIVESPTARAICDFNITLNVIAARRFCARSVTRKQQSNGSADANVLGNSTKLQIISKLNFKSHEDAMPFLNLPPRTLLHIYRVTKNDVKNGYCKNRLYFIAERLKCAPSVLSMRLAQRTFVYSLSFDWLENSLNVLLEMGITSDRLLRDLWVLKYHHATIRTRLQRIKDLDIDTISPWMVRCSEDILQRFISITKETKDILGDSMSTQVYLANRLHTSPAAIEDVYYKIPALKSIRVTKVKSFLDFLQKEGFEVQEIVKKPRILTTSQKTVELRLEKLRKLGLSKINLNVLCKTRKDFTKYCESIDIKQSR